jgi:antitoxin MazE
MVTKIQKWGNSLAVRLPKALLENSGFFQDAPVKIELAPDGILIRPSKKESTLSILLSKVTPKNIHGEVDWGIDVGREKLPVWKNTIIRKKAK